MKKESLIHVKFGYGEAIQPKKDILSSQINVLKILKIVKRYRFLRAEELTTKIILQKKLNETKTILRKLQTILPKLEIPKKLKKNLVVKEEVPKEIRKEEVFDESLESQLRDIQEKLRAMGG